MCIGHAVKGKCGHPVRQEVQFCQDYHDGLACIVLDESPETLQSNCRACVLRHVTLYFCFFFMLVAVLLAGALLAINSHCSSLSPQQQWQDGCLAFTDPTLTPTPSESQIEDPSQFVSEVSVPEASDGPLPDFFDEVMLEGLIDPLPEEDGQS